MQGHRRRRATQRSPVTPISPQGGSGSAGVPFKSLLPLEQQPPLDLNKEIMERFRPLMRKDDLKDKPSFQ
jgi:hypothetical protein